MYCCSINYFKISPTDLVPVAVLILGYIPHNYHLIMTNQSWPDAQNYCRVMYTDIATVVSDTEWLRLQKVAASEGLTTSAWIGLYDDIYSWRWSLNNHLLKDLTYTNWKPGQPNNVQALESCVMINTYGLWLDTSCNLLLPFICYNGE